MSQRNVERIIGRLVTDEGFRRRFASGPEAALLSLSECGVELTHCEIQALVSIDPRQLESFADSIDPRLQKSDLQGSVQ